MSIGLFTDEVIDHFSNPRNAGEMEDANGIGDAGDPGCGDTMRETYSFIAYITEKALSTNEKNEIYQKALEKSALNVIRL